MRLRGLLLRDGDGVSQRLPRFDAPLNDPDCGVLARLDACIERWSGHPYSWPDPIVGLPPEAAADPVGWVRVIVAAVFSIRHWARLRRTSPSDGPLTGVICRLQRSVTPLLEHSPAWSSEHLGDLCSSLLLEAADAPHERPLEWGHRVLARAIELAQEPHEGRTRFLLSRLVETWPGIQPGQLDSFLAVYDAAADDSLLLRHGEDWAEEALRLMVDLWPEERAAWSRLLRWCAGVEGARPSKRHIAAMPGLLASVGSERALAWTVRWVSMFDRSLALHRQLQTLSRLGSSGPEYTAAREKCWTIGHWQALNQRVAKGLVWLLREAPLASTGPSLERAAAACYAQGFVPGVCCALVGQACVSVLASHPEPRAIAHLQRVRDLSRIKPGRSAANRALAELADRMEISPDDVEDIGVPTLDLATDGTRTTRCGSGSIVLRLTDLGAVSVHYRDARGREKKTIPATVRAEHAGVVTAAKADVKLLRGMVQSAAHRLERSLRGRRLWSAAAWRTSLLDHPVLRVVAARLIWTVQADGDGASRQFFLKDGRPVDRHGQATDWPRLVESVRLWHPVEGAPDEVHDWQRLIESSVTQPFRQAHREVYRLDAIDGADPCASVRFADTIILQRTLVGLCKSKDWSMSLFIGSSGSPPVLRVPAEAVLVALDVRPIGEQTDLNGGYRHVLVGRITARHGEEAIPLTAVAPRLLSEVFRDVDLFVSVGAIQGGVTTAFDSHSELQPGAASRRDTAPGAFARQRATLIGRMIAAGVLGDHMCVDGNVLVVQGALNEYRIGIDSGQVWFGPARRPLQITEREIPTEYVVPPLPYADDERLVYILRVALMLAEDIRISDDRLAEQISDRSDDVTGV